MVHLHPRYVQHYCLFCLVSAGRIAILPRLFKRNFVPQCCGLEVKTGGRCFRKFPFTRDHAFVGPVSAPIVSGRCFYKPPGSMSSLRIPRRFRYNLQRLGGPRKAPALVALTCSRGHPNRPIAPDRTPPLLRPKAHPSDTWPHRRSSSCMTDCWKHHFFLPPLVANPPVADLMCHHAQAAAAAAAAPTPASRCRSCRPSRAATLIWSRRSWRT